MYDVITVGSAVLDIYLKSEDFVKIPTGKFEDGVGLCVDYGGKMEVDQIEVTSGGAGTNNAVSFARKGYKVAVICEMGTDLIAGMIKQELESERVDTSMIVQEQNETTGISSIMVSGTGGRAVAVFRGASRMLTVEDIKFEKLEAKYLFITSLGGQPELLESLINHAASNNIKIAFNPGRAENELLSGNRDLREQLLSKVEVLLVNRQEASELMGIDFGKEDIWKSEQRIDGPKIVVITDGKTGGKVWEGANYWFYQPNLVEVVEATGAGDAFGSGFVTGLIEGVGMDQAIEWGRRQAASVVSFMGPKKGLLTLDQISK